MTPQDHGSVCTVILMSFGTATTMEEIPHFLAQVLHRTPESGMIADLEMRYRAIGGSPLLEIMKRQAVALEEALTTARPETRFHVLVGMRHGSPSIEGALDEAVALGSDRIVAIPFAPQDSPDRDQYARRIAEHSATFHGPSVVVAPAWYADTWYLDALAERTRPLVERMRAHGKPVRLLCTAHSLPSHLPGLHMYCDELAETADGVAERVGLPETQWALAFQSVPKGTTRPWLGPDLYGEIRECGAHGDNVVIVPVQFLTDHLEVLYDIDVLAAKTASECGLVMERIPMLNDDPDFTAGLCEMTLSLLVGDRSAVAAG